MTQVTRPDKCAVRQLMAKHREERTPLDPERIKRELGWRMLDDEREAAERHEVRTR